MAQPQAVNKGGRPPGTTREQVIETARRVLEADGVEGLSMRRLAAELGTAPTAIYWHVGGRDELLQAVVAQLLEEMAAIVPKGRTPRARLRSIARAIRAEVHAHPYLIEAARQIGQGPATNFPGQLALARELTAIGLRGEAAARALRSIVYLVGGFILVEALPDDPGPPVSARELWRSVDDPDVDPELTKAMAAEPDMEEMFNYALDQLLAALLA